MRKTYKYRLLGNKTTFSRADEWLVLCQRLYNIALEQRIYIYCNSRQTISCYDQSKQLPELKEAFPEYQLVGSQVLQDVIFRLDKAYQAFFRRGKNGYGKAGFPRFKSRDRYHNSSARRLPPLGDRGIAGILLNIWHCG